VHGSNAEFQWHRSLPIFPRHSGSSILRWCCFLVQRLVYQEGTWKEAGKEEEENDGDDAGERSLENEDPSPRSVVTHAIHFTNGGS